MKTFCSMSGVMLSCLVALGWANMAQASPPPVQQVALAAISTIQDCISFAATPRWWEETVQWVKSIGWDRGRLVQMWLFFMLVGLYVILRIKPRA